MVVGYDMGKQEWLTLNEYSVKYGVSISTLRRRVRNQQIRFRLEEGKYLVADATTPLESPGRKQIPMPGQVKAIEMETPVAQVSNHDGAGFFGAAQKLLEELKKAYTLILQEKEEQICQLKDEISDLRTLVRVLEEENDRLKTSANR